MATSARTGRAEEGAGAAETPPDYLWALSLVAATFFMGSSFIAGKILLRSIPPLPLLGWRFLAAAMLVWVLARLIERDPAPRLSARQRGLVAALGLLQTGANMTFMFLALRRISPAATAILAFTNPLWVAVLATVFLRERLRAVQVLGLLLGLGGVALALGLERGEDFGGQLLALGSALSWASATVLHRWARLPLGPWRLSFWQMLTGSLAILLVGTLAGEHWPAQLSASDWGWFAWLVGPGSAASFGLWFVALRRGGATRSSAFLFLAPLFAVALSHFVLSTPLSLAQLAGGALVAAALYLVNRPTRR
ncbi:MAG: DMT family transporter [Verrucomicrobia bacterium]|nr:DMT family transporter [Verrucomicrobiota bacterium]